MTRPASRRVLVLLVAGCLAGLGLAAVFVLRERESLQRGNRFYREGRVVEAEEIYRVRVRSDPAPGTSAYNLGTALLALGAPEAEEYLRIAVEAGDSATAQRGYYNLGHQFLTRLDQVAEPIQAIRLLGAAVGSNRAALRLDPRDEGARWNLSLAQRLLDSLVLVVDLDEGPTREEETDRSEGGVVLPRVARLGTPSGREREALAGVDPGTLNEAEARAMVQAVAPDMERLIRGLLWSHRPDVSPWLEPYPGGDW